MGWWLLAFILGWLAGAFPWLRSLRKPSEQQPSKQQPDNTGGGGDYRHPSLRSDVEPMELHGYDSHGCHSKVLIKKDNAPEVVRFLNDSIKKE